MACCVTGEEGEDSDDSQQLADAGKEGQRLPGADGIAGRHPLDPGAREVSTQRGEVSGKAYLV